MIFVQIFERGEMLRIARKFDLKILDIVSHLEVENVQSHGAILMFFITYHACREFQLRVTFDTEVEEAYTYSCGQRTRICSKSACIVIYMYIA